MFDFIHFDAPSRSGAGYPASVHGFFGSPRVSTTDRTVNPIASRPAILARMKLRRVHPSRGHRSSVAEAAAKSARGAKYSTNRPESRYITNAPSMNATSRRVLALNAPPRNAPARNVPTKQRSTRVEETTSDRGDTDSNSRPSRTT